MRITKVRTILMLPGLLLAGVALVLPGYATASGVACDEPASTGFDPLIDCGTYIGTVDPGNDGNGPLTIGGTSYTQYAKYDASTSSWTTDPAGTETITGVPGASGTWSLASAVQFMVVKASTGYTIYGQGALASGTVASGTFTFAGASSGNWATAPELLGGDVAGRNLSHLSFYGPTDGGGGGQQLPEPATLGLVGMALLGMGYRRRRRAS